ncbi:CvpA family protein [Candidatus Berkelbacteria bacterium]|nr:CvpA family protein [Candidatus Berkelbacteria bacterium]
MAEDLETQISELTRAVRQSNRQNGLWYSFWHGIVSGIGSTVGVAAVLTVVAFLLRNLIQIPFLSSLNRVLPKVEQTLENTAQSKTEKFPAVVPSQTQTTPVETTQPELPSQNQTKVQN